MSFLNQYLRSSVILPVLALVVGSVLLAAVVVFYAPMGGVAVIAVSVASLVMILVFRKYEWGIYFLLLFGVFMHHVARIFETGLPFGVPYDLLIGVTLLSLLASNRSKKLDWSYFGNWISYAYFFVLGFHLLQILNPLGSPLAWAVSLRSFGLFLLYIVSYHYFHSFKNVKKFTFAYLAVVFSVALYGIFQEVFGLLDFEWDYIYELPERYNLFYIGGRMRKFSFLSDPSAYGIYVACGALSCIVLMLSLKNYLYKIIFGILALIMLQAMTYSSTRTAMVMVAAGVAFYILMTIRSRKTMLIAMAAVALFLVILYGPFNNWQVQRIRSAFRPSEDASMAVRDVKRIGFQPFIRSHPIGGGPFTTADNGKKYASGHTFRGIDPDGGYLEVGLEKGWIGLILYLALNIATFFRGINSYFQTKDRIVRTAILVYLVPFFALTLGHYAQEVMATKPMDLLVIMTMGLMSRFPQFVNEKVENLNILNKQI